MKHTYLALIIAAAINPALAATECNSETTNCETVTIEKGSKNYGNRDTIVANGDGINFVNGNWNTTGLKHNVTVTGEKAIAVHINKGADFRGNLYLEGKNIISENGTAIKVDGDFLSKNSKNPNLGIYLKDGAVVKGRDNAINFLKSTKTMRIDANGTVIGNIIGNNLPGNKMNLGYQGSAGKSFTFDGDKIIGVGKIDNRGKLTIVARDDKSVRFETNFTNMKNGSIDFQISGNNTLDHALLFVDGKVDFQDNSKVGFTYKGENIKNLIGKQIILIESSREMSGGQNVTVTGSSDGVFDLSPLLAVDDSWIKELPPKVNGGVIGNQLIATYDVNYKGGEAFIDNGKLGGATTSEQATSKYIVDYALAQYNKTKSNESGELLALLTSVGNNTQLTTQLFDELTPDADGAEIQSALQNADKIRSTLNQRSSNLRSSLVSEGWNLTPHILVSYGKNGSSTNYETNTYGVNVTADRLITDENYIGFGLGYLSNSIDYDNDNKKINGFHLSGYTGWFDDNTFVDINFNAGYSSVASSRYIGLASGFENKTKAKMDYNMLQIGYQLTVGYKFNIDVVHIEPFLSYKHQWVRIDDRQETGSIASLQYDRQTYSAGHMGGGINFSASFDMPYGTFTPSATIAAYYDTNKNDNITESFGLVIDKESNPQRGNRQIINGAPVGGDVIEATLSASVRLDNNLFIDSSLSYYNQDEYNEGMVGLSISKKF